MFGKGKHTSRELIRRLRSENRHFERQMPLMQKRLRHVGELLRAETSQREVADGLVLKQTAELQAKEQQITELKRELSERTVEMPIPKLPEPGLAEAIA